jgi:DNA relaxase NicK
VQRNRKKHTQGENVVIATVLIDYLVFSKKDMDADRVITSLLDMDKSLFIMGRGFNFYAHSKAFSNIRVMYDGYGASGINMGVCVSMSGQGVRAWEEHTDSSIMKLLAKLVNDPGIHISRLDVAVDDMGGGLDLETIRDCAAQGRYRTRTTAVSCTESRKGKSEGAGAISCYWGSPSSLYRLKFYDKAKEHYDPVREPDMYASHWVRCELTLRNDYAEQAARLLVAGADNPGAVVAGLVADKFAFVNLDNENISQCSIADWWSAWLGEVGSVKLLAKPKASHSIEQHRDWLMYCCGRVAAKVYQAIGEARFKREVLGYGDTKLTAPDRVQIRDYKTQRGG